MNDESRTIRAAEFTRRLAELHALYAADIRSTIERASK